MQRSFASTNLGTELSFSPDGKTIAVPDSTDINRIALLDIATGRVSGRLQLPGTATRYQAFSPDSKTLAVWYANGKIKLCHVASGREVATLEGHDTFGMHLSFSHNGETIATASNDGTIHLWRAPRNQATPFGTISAASR
jgi:WD40 repeat protein